MKTQSEATINAIINLCNERGYEHTPFETDYKTILKPDDMKDVVELITAGMTTGQIQMSESAHAKFDDDPKALRRYVVGLVNDRLRKAKAINGNIKYEYKQPGKLSGSKDPQLKALMQLKQLHPDNEDIEQAITARQEALKPKVEIDVSVLPADLIEKLGLNKTEETTEEAE